MAINLTIELSREFEMPGSLEQVFELLADVPRSGSHFPKVDQLVDLGGGTYRWEMEKIGVDKHALQTVYACNYKTDVAAGRITWDPVVGEGNSQVKGEWRLSAVNGSVTRAIFKTKADMTLPLPSLLKLAISPVVKHEFNGLVDIYIKNLQKVFA